MASGQDLTLDADQGRFPGARDPQFANPTVRSTATALTGIKVLRRRSFNTIERLTVNEILGMEENQPLDQVADRMTIQHLIAVIHAHQGQITALNENLRGMREDQRRLENTMLHVFHQTRRRDPRCRGDIAPISTWTSLDPPYQMRIAKALKKQTELKLEAMKDRPDVAVCMSCSSVDIRPVLRAAIQTLNRILTTPARQRVTTLLPKNICLYCCGVANCDDNT